MWKCAERTGAPVAGLYIGYYQSQRQGSSMHSPMNCLPGSGWQPIRGGRLSIESASVSVKGVVELDGNGELLSANFPTFNFSNRDKTTLKADRSADGALRSSLALTNRSQTSSCNCPMRIRQPVRTV